MTPASSTTPDADQLALLADAISDVGYWTWWAQDIPEVFQVEFGGTQLYFPPTSPDQAPPSQIALQFRQPTCVCFLYRGENTDHFGWVELLHNDQLEPPTCSYGEFSFGDDDTLRSLLDLATHQRLVHGYAPTEAAFLREAYRLVFWCGDYGMAIAAPALRILSHNGEISLDQDKEANRQWWEYWRTYWDKRFTPDALPHDYACEVTIPTKDFDRNPDTPTADAAH